MNAPSQENFLQALSFLSPDLRAALTEAPDGSTYSTLPERQVALLWCDIVGFSKHTNERLRSGDEGVEKLHRDVQEHFDQLLRCILLHGGEPVTFVGDGLISVWPVGPDGMRAAVSRATKTAHKLIEARAAGETLFDLNQHISCGTFQTLELGGRHGRWLRTSVGSALKELEQIASLKRPNEIILTARAAACCDPQAVTEPIGPRNACLFIGDAPVVDHAATVLAVPSLDAWPAAVERLPRSAVGWLESVGLQFLADLRPITALNVALHSFDQANAEAPSMLNGIVQAIQDVVHGRDGYVAEVVVDEKGASVLITFGTPPDAHSDDPLRGVLSAGDILEKFKSMGVCASIGAATGRILCCIVGTAERRSFLVLGDALIRCTRLSHASNSGVLVDQSTMRATGDTVTYANDPLMINVKGAKGPIPVWAVTSDQTKLITPRKFVGRAAEIARLHQLWEHATRGGANRHVIIEADSGYGKTSLALSLREKIVSEGGVFRLEAASAIEQETPFSAFRHLLMETLNVTSVGVADTRGDAVLKNIPAHLRDSAPLLNAIFATGLNETAVTADLTGNSRAERILDLVVEILVASFRGKPTCLCIDDAQWLDSSSQKALARLAEAAPKLMIVILSQRQPKTTWARFTTETGFELMRLGPLSPDELEELICLRLGCEEVDTNLLEQIASRTDCHPFFSAELLQSLTDVDALHVKAGTAFLRTENPLGSAALPDTLHGMVLQRLDRLHPAEQLSIRVASVAGLSFPTKLVCDIHPIQRSEVEVSQQLSHQVSNGFLLETNAEELPGYTFTHGIVREVAHSQLPLPQRSGLHAQAAEWIEKNNSSDRDSKLLELAHHWTEAGDGDRAINCLLEEALRLFSQGFAVEAVRVGCRAISMSGVIVPTGETDLELQIRSNMASIESKIGERHPTELIAHMRQPDHDLGIKLQSLLSVAPFAFQSNQFEVFSWASTEAMRLVVEHSAGPPHAFSMYSIVKTLLTGDKVSGAAWSRAALDLDDATGGSALPAVSFIDTWFHGHWRAPLRESIRINNAGAQRALADNDVQYSSYNIAGGVILTAAAGQTLEDVISHAETTLSHSHHRNSRMHVLLEMQFARALRNETLDRFSLSGQGIDEEDDIAWVTTTEFANQIGYYFATRARLHRYAGDWSGALSWADRTTALRPAIAGQIAEFELVLHTLLARVGAVLSNQSTIDDHIAQIETEMAQLRQWKNMQGDNFSAKAHMAESALAGLQGDLSAADKLSELGRSLGPNEWLQDRALAFEYAARILPETHRIDQAIKAYEDWGAIGVAQRIRMHGV